MDAMSQAIAVLNAGSSSLKFSVFEVAGEQLTLQLKGQIEGIGTAPKFVAKSAAGEELGAKTWDQGTPLGHDGAIAHLIEFLRERRGDSQLVAVGRRAGKRTPLPITPAASIAVTIHERADREVG